jgi:Flp pilus assembly protein TadG
MSGRQTRNARPKRPRGAIAGSARRLIGDKQAIAAVEFALILPLMLMIYLGLVEFSRGLRASQKLDLVAHVLADLTAQKLTGGAGTGQAGINNSDVTAIFGAATTLMSLPSDDTTVKMTISEVTITAPTPTTWEARTSWSIVKNGATKRNCQLLDAADVAPVSFTTMPTSYTTASASGVNPVTGSVIVADVVYSYSPKINFEFYKWQSAPTWTMQRTSYAAVRNTYSPNHIQYVGTITGGTNCP